MINIGTKRVVAYSSESAKKVFRNQNPNLVPTSAKRVGTLRGRRVYEVAYRKSKR